MTTAATMHIGEVARAADTTVPVVRKYDQEGLLPAASRSEGGFRLYTEADVRRLHLLRRMRLFGFTADEMRQLLALLDVTSPSAAGGAATAAAADVSPDQVATALGCFLERARARERRLRSQLRSAHELITTIESALSSSAGTRPDHP